MSCYSFQKLLNGQLPEPSFASVTFWQLACIYSDLVFCMEVKILLYLHFLYMENKFTFSATSSREKYLTCSKTLILTFKTYDCHY
jgi:hypothetical protein